MAVVGLYSRIRQVSLLVLLVAVFYLLVVKVFAQEKHDGAPLVKRHYTSEENGEVFVDISAEDDDDTINSRVKEKLKFFKGAAKTHHDEKSSHKWLPNRKEGDLPTENYGEDSDYEDDDDNDDEDEFDGVEGSDDEFPSKRKARGGLKGPRVGGVLHPGQDRRHGSPPAPNKKERPDKKIRTTIPDSCPEYTKYASLPHYPLSDGPLRLPLQRPASACRTFKSPLVESIIRDMKDKLRDSDVARLFENCFPNTLDTTIKWHHNGTNPRTFVITGDIDAEWIRDSHRQLSVYLPLASRDPAVKQLIKGAIGVQAEYMSQFPYCNAFHPPKGSGLKNPPHANVGDDVYPAVDKQVVFECKYELDSLGSFLGITNDYYRTTGDLSFVNGEWLAAFNKVVATIKEQMIPTYVDGGTGTAISPKYTFQRNTNLGTETLNLDGAGNPVNANISLVRSAFRPSDDATIYQFFIPANAQAAVELKRASSILEAVGQPDTAKEVLELSKKIEKAIWDHGVYEHKVFGKVFAYEIDGFGGITCMDDANIPSLLSLPDLGFVNRDNPVYLNTRKMILSKAGNPYYLKGKYFSGIGGPHIGIRNAWPMSHLMAMRTTDNEDEIKFLLELIKKSTGGLGLMHETVNVDIPFSYTRPWFAWANSEFAKTILDIATRKPHLLFDGRVTPEDIYEGDGKLDLGTDTDTFSGKVADIVIQAEELHELYGN